MALDVIPKICPSEEAQSPLESRQVWKEVTSAIHAGEFSKATKVKQMIEGRQRKLAAERHDHGQEWEPRYFLMESNGGRAVLTSEGREMLERLGRKEN